MEIQKKFLERTLKEADAFIYVLKALNAGTENQVSPKALLTRLERGSSSITSHVAIADYWREQGVSDEELFNLDINEENETKDIH